MKKSLIALAMVILMATQAYAWGFEAFGYKIEYKVKQQSSPIEQTSTLSTPPDETTRLFGMEVDYLNSMPEVQMVLKELDYGRIGLYNTDDGNSYTAHINPDGTIKEVKSGLQSPEVVVQGSLSMVRGGVERGDVGMIKSSVKLPFVVKAKLLIYVYL